VSRKVPTILIVRCGLLGDTIDSTAVVRPLINYYGNDLKIEWITKPSLKDLFKYDSRISPLIVRSTKLPLLINFGKLKIILKSYFKPYDAVINLEVGTKFDSLVKLIKSEVKIGQPYRHIDTQYKGEHRVNHQLRIIESYFKGFNTDKAYPYLKGSNIDVKKKYNLKKSYIVICPTNSKFKKKNHRGYRAWPLNNWNNLVKKVITQKKLDIVITGGKNEKEFIDQLDIRNDRVHNLCGKTSLPNLFEVMKNSECVIANDSGSVHMAGVSCKKVISLHGPTPFKETGPYGNSTNEIIEANLNMRCSPCFNTSRITSCPENKCMIDLSPDTVLAYILK
jgi:ADP-heptose:LPS heptosyltransferase